MNLKDFIRSIPDYPKKGILFRDITTLIKNEKAFANTINQIVEKSKKFKFNKIAAIEYPNLQLERDKKTIPIGGSFRDELIKKLNLI